jgi:multiple antibiotic resistance protein
MAQLFLISFTALFSVMNPFGTVPVFVALTKESSVEERITIAKKTSFYVFIILLTSFFAGSYVLNFFGIDIDSLKIAGGLIIASSGFALLTGEFTKHKGMKRSKVRADVENRSDISLTPLALPMIAGPGTISLLITYRHEQTELWAVGVLLGAMLLASLCIFTILRSSHLIVRLLGASGVNALSRIIGFIVIAIGIEFIRAALLSIVTSYIG